MKSIDQYIENAIRKGLNIKNNVLNKFPLKHFNELLMTKKEKTVKKLVIENIEDCLSRIQTEEKEKANIIKRIDNLLTCEGSNKYYFDEVSNCFRYNIIDLRIEVLKYKEYYKKEIDELKKEISFECGRVLDWLGGTQPPFVGCEYLRPILFETVVNDMEINYKKWEKNSKATITLEIVEKVIEDDQIKECILKKTLEYDKKLLKNLK